MYPREHDGSGRRRREALARYRTTCPACGQPIQRFSPILRDVDGWVCLACWEDREVAAAAIAEQEPG
jgi:hypothetical protein